nr:homocysteine S-methyltransferase family protein [Myxococcota bacterium]
VERGAQAVLVDCVPADRTLAFVEALASAGVPFGAYANAGCPEDRIGWAATTDEPQRAAERYLAHAETWIAAGATLVGSCCGTGPAHVAALSRRFSGT